MLEQGEMTRWLHPDSERKAIHRARDRANAARWNLDIAVLLFCVLTFVFILSIGQVGVFLISFVAVFGLSIAWIIGWRRATKVFWQFLEEELAKYSGDWKDYYRILRISPGANSEIINEAFTRLSEVFSKKLPNETKRLPLYSLMLREINEAHQVLSDTEVRPSYDNVWWFKCNTANTNLAESAKYELVNLPQSIPSTLSDTLKELNWGFPRISKAIRTVVIGTIIIFSSLVITGTTIVFAKPEHTLAAPFKGVAISVTKASAGAIGLIEEVRGIVAIYESKIVSTAVHSIRIDEKLERVPVVISATNDMAHFPSTEYPLFPEYLDTRYSQFRYTIDTKGIVSVDKSGTTTDAFLNRITQFISRLESN